ncbi:hypothetical protein RIF29_21414 [Crotalaria pallida]|uniref:Uncharacterized protein n=1 Tax=Crotalaria pallida TaxID=3830 RepID=A0AAN9F7A6_CROPI
MSLGKGVIVSYTEVGGGGSSSCNFRPEVVRASNFHNSVALPTYPPHHGFGMVVEGAYSAIGAGCGAVGFAQDAVLLASHKKVAPFPPRVSIMFTLSILKKMFTLC